MNESELSRSLLEFQHKAILTRGMLREMDQFPRQLLRLHYQGYSNGICCGMDFSEENGEVSLSPGLIRLNGEFYILDAPVSLSGLAYKARKGGDQNQRYYFLIEPGGERWVDGVRYEFLKISVAQHQGRGGENLELASFYNGIELKLPDQQAKNLQDEFERNSRMGLLLTPYASLGKPTFHPYVCVAIKNYLLRKKIKSPLDWNLILLLEQRPLLSLDTIQAFILAKLKESVDLPISQKLFDYLCKAMDVYDVPEYQQRAAEPAKEENKGQYTMPRVLPLG